MEKSKYKIFIIISILLVLFNFYLCNVFIKNMLGDPLDRVNIEKFQENKIIRLKKISLLQLILVIISLVFIVISFRKIDMLNTILIIFSCILHIIFLLFFINFSFQSFFK